MSTLQTIMSGVFSPQRRLLPYPSPEPSLVRPQSKRALLACALTTSLLLYCSFFPLSWGWLGWVALVPLLLLVRGTARPLTLYSIALLGGLAFYVPVLQWMRVADDAMYFAWAVLALYCALYFPIALLLLRYLDRRTRLPLTLTAPLVWTALEYLRSELGTGFSWYLLGHTQHDYLWMIQIADLAGAYGVSFLVVMVNGLLVEALWVLPSVRRFVLRTDTVALLPLRWVIVQTVLVASLLVSVGGYGVYRLRQNDFIYGPRIVLIQGNLDQRVRNNPNLAMDFAQHYIDLCDLAAQTHELDLIVWPETSYPPVWKEESLGVPAEDCANEAAEMATRWKVPVLLGLKSSIPEAEGRVEYNSALLLAGGQAIDRYDKIHLVPLGEYVPFRQTFPILKKLAPYDFEYSVESGRKHTRFPLYEKLQGRDYTFGVAICYEDTDPDMTRPYGGGDGQRPVDFILNTSNDGWFNGTSEHEQHLAIARFRAVECRRSIGRSVNMGISALIDPNGRVLPPKHLDIVKSREHKDKEPYPIEIWGIDQSRWGQSLPVFQWADFKKVPGLLFVAMPIDSRSSFYARAGDWLPWSCWGLLALGLVVGTLRRRAE